MFEHVVEFLEDRDWKRVSDTRWEKSFIDYTMVINYCSKSLTLEMKLWGERKYGMSALFTLYDLPLLDFARYYNLYRSDLITAWEA